MEEVFAQFYDPNAQPPTDDPILSHRLALMFIILAIGTLVDTNLPAYNLDAEKYHQLARAALFQNGLFDEPTINAVQALVSHHVHVNGVHESLTSFVWCSISCHIISSWRIAMAADRGCGGQLWA